MGTKQKVYRIFNRCEDAQEQGNYHNGEQNCFECQKRPVVNSAGIQGQIIADVLQKRREFLWRSRMKKVKAEKVLQGSSNPYSPRARANFGFAKQLAI
eukprot:12925931-Ditylum_brightwellii.AAC.1